MAAQRRRLDNDLGPWEMDLTRRDLRAHGIPVPLGSRAFDIVEVLARSAGELVTKDEIMREVWSGAIVEESAVQVHISAIRKALGPDRGLLKTAFGRGYRLLGAWTIRHRSARNDRGLCRDQFAVARAPGCRLTGGPPLGRGSARRETSARALCRARMGGRLAFNRDIMFGNRPGKSPLLNRQQCHRSIALR